MAENNKFNEDEFKNQLPPNEQEGKQVIYYVTQEKENTVSKLANKTGGKIKNKASSLWNSGDSGSILDVFRIGVEFTIGLISALITAIQTFIDERANRNKDNEQ